MKQRAGAFARWRNTILRIALCATILVEGYRVNMGTSLLLFCCGVGLNLFNLATKVKKP